MKIKVRLINETKKSLLSRKRAEDILDLALSAAGFGKLFKNKEVTSSIWLVSDKKIRSLNKKYRGIDKPTDVLSFPLLMWKEGVDYPQIELGDIFLAPDFISHKTESAAEGIRRHTDFLLAHGFLHLLEFDHETDRQEKEMQNLEKKIMNSLNK